MRLAYYLIITTAFLFSCQSEKDETILNTGRTDFHIEVDGAERHAAVHVPASYDGSQEYPMILMLHGTGGTGNKFYNVSGWVGKAEEEGIIAVFPTALEYDLIDGTRTTKWSSDGLTEQLAPGTEVRDDKIFIERLLNELIGDLKIDQRRIYICGFSNGSGFVKSEIIPNMGHLFAAANVTGGIGIPQSYEISGGRTMPVFNIAGTMDVKVFEKIGDNSELPIEGMDIENHDFIWGQISTFCDMLGLEVEYDEMPNPPSWNQLVFKNKMDNTASDEYRFMMVKDMAHVFPNGSNNPRGVKAVDHLWPWFERWSL